MQNILITGVAGFIGSRLAKYILDNYRDKYHIVGIDNLFGGYLDNIPDGVEFYNKDINSDLDELFKQYKFEYVYHIAAYATEGLSPFIRKFNYDNNLRGTVNIVNACVNYNVKRLIFTSSMSVYGPTNKRYKEDDIPQPIDSYAISKYACELDIKAASEQFGLDYCIIRPHNVYGINQNIWDIYRNVIGIWMYQILQDKPITIYGDGKQTRAFTCIDNILEPMYQGMVSNIASKEIFNLGALEGISVNNAANILQEITGYDKVIYLENRYEVKHAIPNGEKSVKLLGYKENISFREGVKKMWEWAKQQPNRKQFKWDKYEIDKNMYEYWK